MASSWPGLSEAGTCLHSHGLLDEALSSASHLLLLWDGALGERGAEQHLPPCSTFPWHWALLHPGALARRAGMEQVPVPPQRQCLCCRAGVAREPSLVWPPVTADCKTCADNIYWINTVFLRLASKLPKATFLLLKHLLTLLQNSSSNAATSKMTATNLAVCMGPNLLSPAEEHTLPLDVPVQVAEGYSFLQSPSTTKTSRLFFQFLSPSLRVIPQVSSQQPFP